MHPKFKVHWSGKCCESFRSEPRTLFQMKMRACRAFHWVQVSWEVFCPAIGGPPPSMHGSAFIMQHGGWVPCRKAYNLLFRSGMYGLLAQSSDFVLLYKISKFRPSRSQYQIVIIIVCLGNYIHTTTTKFGPRISREANHIGPGATASQKQITTV